MAKIKIDTIINDVVAKAIKRYYEAPVTLSLEIILRQVIDEVLEPAKRLCKIYFDIAAEVVGEEEVRRRRDAIIGKDKNDGPITTN